MLITDGDRRRINWVDAGKCIGIFLVIFGHNGLHPQYNFLIYAFHMPLFFVLSGYTFSDNHNIWSFFIRKTRSLMIPYVTFAVVCSMYYVVYHWVNSGILNTQGMFDRYLIWGSTTFLWFITTLFVSEIVTYILSKCGLLSTLGRCMATVVVLFTLGYVFAYIYVVDFYYFGIARLVPPATAYIVIGIIYRRYIQGFRLEKNWLFIIMIICAYLCLATLNFSQHGLTTMFGTGNYAVYIITAVLATYGLILVLKRYNFPLWFIYIGANSIMFYGLHEILIDTCFTVYCHLGVDYDRGSLQSVLMALGNTAIVFVVIYPVSKLVNRYVPWLIGRN